MDQTAMQQVPVCDLVRVRMYVVTSKESAETPVFEKIVFKNELLQHI